MIAERIIPKTLTIPQNIDDSQNGILMAPLFLYQDVRKAPPSGAGLLQFYKYFICSLIHAVITGAAL